MYKEFGISEKLEKLAKKTANEIQEILKEIDDTSMYNSQKVLIAFQENNISEMHFGATTGYGEGDVREKCNRKNIYKSIRCRR